MKTIHLLRVDAGPEDFARLFAAAREAEVVAGWLELDEPDAPPATLDRAAELGALRAVAAGETRTVTLKRRRGPAVLGDLLREHFRGCRVVLVRGEVPAARLQAAGELWRIEPQEGETRELSTEALVRRLRRPRPWS